MKTCPVCHWHYPDRLVQPVRLGDSTLLACGICALELCNTYHGITRAKFGGTIAEDVRQRAIRYRAAHPERAPANVRH